MQQWEHRVAPLAGPDDLRAWGEQGWELVAVREGTAYLRRPAPSFRERVTEEQRQAALGAAGAPPVSGPGRRLLHPEVLRAFAQVGHTDLVTIADRGFPVPLGIERIDLALTDDLPTVLDVLEVLLPLFRPDRLVLTLEMRAVSPARVRELEALVGERKLEFVSHEAFKRLAGEVRATVRTGDSTPYANVIWVG